MSSKAPMAWITMNQQKLNGQPLSLRDELQCKSFRYSLAVIGSAICCLTQYAGFTHQLIIYLTWLKHKTSCGSMSNAFLSGFFCHCYQWLIYTLIRATFSYGDTTPAFLFMCISESFSAACLSKWWASQSFTQAKVYWLIMCWTGKNSENKQRKKNPN